MSWRLIPPEEVLTLDAGFDLKAESFADCLEWLGEGRFRYYILFAHVCTTSIGLSSNLVLRAGIDC